MSLSNAKVSKELDILVGGIKEHITHATVEFLQTRGNMIRYARQNVSQEDIDSVIEVLRSDFLTQGPSVSRFELAVAQYCVAQHSVSVNSSTSALHIACLALDLGHGDWLWTTQILCRQRKQRFYCGIRSISLILTRAPTTLAWNDLIKAYGRERWAVAQNCVASPLCWPTLRCAGDICVKPAIWLQNH